MAQSRKPLYPHNRKYIGSKQPLLPFIAQVLAEQAPEVQSIADPFCGTGVVAYHFAAQSMRIIAGDTLHHNVVALRCFLGADGGVDPGRIHDLLSILEALPPLDGYCTAHFGGTYFTLENARRMDAMREQIACWAQERAISTQEEAVLLTSLLYAVDKVANTCGQYDAYLKHLGSTPYSPTGAHVVDATVYKPLELGLPQVLASGAEVYCQDANQLVPHIETDLLYLDPPYNSRQYVDNYHVLENIARWEKPELSGVTRKFDRRGLKSPYSSRRLAASALGDLIRRARCNHILISYNNEGIVPDDALLSLLSERGTPRVFTRPYSIFGHGAGRSGRRPIEERLFYCRVEAPPLA